jgi:catechol-2,3-dioxygenase
MRVLHTIVNEASFTVGDLERSTRFYTEVVNEASFIKKPPGRS